MEAKERLIKGNLRLVLSVIKRFSSSNENVDDLFQIGCIGLIKAINNFDTTLQVKFSTYAVPMILGEVKRYIDSYKKKYVENFKQELMLAHLNADLMYLSIGRLFDKEAKYPELVDIYPELFKQELEQREIQREQEAIAKRQAEVRENLFNILQHTLIHDKKEESKNEEGSEINNGEEQRGSANTGQS